jgi:ribosomal 50S subunit-recycling heat shock protein
MVLPDGQNHFFFIVFVIREKHIGGENMRLDKFLKLSRVIKRRTVAASAADAGRVAVNGRIAKPGHKLKVGDEILIEFGGSSLKIRVRELRENIRKEEADMLYEVIDQ